jgi:uncharacterized protein YgiM (DUF1202 family)
VALPTGQRVVCFSRFFVSDITDAMILATAYSKESSSKQRQPGLGVNVRRRAGKRRNDVDGGVNYRACAP